MAGKRQKKVTQDLTRLGNTKEEKKNSFRNLGLVEIIIAIAAIVVVAAYWIIKDYNEGKPFFAWIAVAVLAIAAILYAYTNSRKE